MISIKYVVDTWSWIEYLISSSSGEKVKEIVEDDKNEIYINSIILAEVISKTAREKRDSKIAFDALIALSIVVEIDDPNFSRDVGILHAEIKQKIRDFGLADAYVLLTARKINARIVTGDPHFKDFRETIMIERVERKE